MKIYRLFTIILFCSISFNVLGQKMDYDKEWKKIENLMQKEGKPQSALTEVKKIYAAAKAEKKDAQLIKALVYMSLLQEQTREENLVQSIRETESEISQAGEPARSILKSFLASRYLRYFQFNRYKYYDRTQTEDYVKNRIETWSARDLHAKISTLYLESISNEALLKQTRLDAYDPIIIKGNTRQLRPTLYDLLAHQALNYFRNDERMIQKPAYAFEIEQEEAFGPARSFASYKFITRDSLSLHHKAILIYQDLIRFHIQQNNAEALMDVDLQRIQFVYAHSTHPDKEELYQKALQDIISANKGRNAYQAHYLLAAYYENLANRYDPFGDTTNRLERIKARNILIPVVNDSTVKNEGWTNSYNLLQQIQLPSFSFEVERVNLPGKPSRVLVQYRNAEQLFFRVIRMNAELKKMVERGMDEKYWTTIAAATPVRSWQQSLPATKDLQQHRTEVKMDALPLGEYILIASLNEKINLKQGLGAQVFHVSNISYLQSDNIFFVLHRETGDPIHKAKADVFTRIYNYSENRYTRLKHGTYTVNDKGYFAIAKTKDHQNYWIDIIHEKDTLSINENYYSYQYYNEEREEPGIRIIYFTDRSIYRPSQKVFFKGIALQRNKSNNVIADHKTRVYLRDANYQLVDSLDVTSNEFGSFSGSFQLPSNVLTGHFFITDKEERNSVSFSVEEYKRLKFVVEFEKLKETYKLGQVIQVKGTAKAYAGNTIADAKVTYRVIRQARFPYPWWERKSWLPVSAPMEIANGEVTTDKDGKFTVSFTALPDKKIDPKFDPLFSYIVSADITDINGETRSASTTITAGYKSLVLSVAIPGSIHKDSLQKLNIRTENLNGEFQSSLARVSFTRLIPENRLIRKRYWSRPDQFVMSKDEFLSYFPNDEYNNETDPSTWKKGDTVYSGQDSTRPDGQWRMGSHNIGPGFYQVEILTRDKEGKEVKTVKMLEVFEPGKLSPGSQQYLVHRAPANPVEPGQTATSFIGSSAGIYLVRYIDKKDSKGINENIFNYHRTGNGISSFNYTATEDDRGGFGVVYFFVKDNRVYMVNETILVPWTNKQLNISYATFRDKTLPGSEEKWKLTIKGYKNEKIASEILASMYDASIDQFKPHVWQLPSLWPQYYFNSRWNTSQNFTSVNSNVFGNTGIQYRQFNKEYDRFIFGSDGNYTVRLRGMGGMVPGVEVSQSLEEVTVSAAGMKRQSAAPPMDAAANLMNGESADTTRDAEGEAGEMNAPAEFQVRKNFNETAFFFPHLSADKDGNIEFSFTIPEALTKWKFQAFAHTKDMAMSVSQKEIVTQKELMVQTNAPRFLRQGDRIEFSTKIANLSDKELTGQVELLLINTTTGKPVDGWFMNSRANQYFTVAPNGSASVSFPLQVPFEFNDLISWRIVAKSGNYSDGEENILPVLTNKVLVTETLPLQIRGNGEKKYSFEKLKNSGGSTSLQHHALTLEYTSNPAWFAVQALPYLNESTYDNAEQIWNRYYANALASRIANASPRLKQVFEKWKDSDTTALVSNLQKNQELKNILLEETPWVLAAKSETEQKRNIAMLFDMIRMTNELKSSLEKLRSFQSPNGGFVWFKGGPDDRYMTQYVVTGIGHLGKLGVDISPLQSILNSALPYLDRKIKEDHDQLIRSKANLSKQHINYIQIQYLYMRSFFKKEIPSASRPAYTYYSKQAKQFWVGQNRYMQGMIALVLFRNGDQQTAAKVLASLKETSIVNEEMGRYWKDVRYGYSWFWWHAPIEAQSLLIEAFSEITKDNSAVDEMKTWLIKNKQTTHWRTSKATAEACYAMLLQGTGWIESEPKVVVTLGNTVVDSEKQTTQAGTGYFKTRVEGNAIDPSMGNISLNVRSESNSSMPSWGAVYWQYFEDMDKVENASTPLQINKKLFIKKNSDRGPVLQPLNEGMELNVGDKVTVRVEIRTDRDMEYVHMKDMRASSLEPVNVLSGYKWKGGLGYYESTRDASTNFFFSYLPKGNYVFEYDLFVSHKGSFSNGITTIQCLYAPEFAAHSEGVKIRVD